MKAILLLAIVVAACDDSPVSREVGARCDVTSDCDERCLTGPHWPGGFCMVSCSHDVDCPLGTYCLAEEGGVCAFDCHADADCLFLKDDYRCKERDLTSGDKVLVCRGD